MNVCEVSTCKHLGDALCVSAALANASRVLPDWRFYYSGNYEEIYQGTPWTRERGVYPTHTVRCEYRDFGVTDTDASGGSLCDGLTLSLSRHLGVDIPAVVRAPVVALSEDERTWADSHPARGSVLLNTNCQTCSSVKGYPWWREVTECLPDVPFYLTGGREERDIRDNSPFPGNVRDLRGQTSFRELLALASVCGCVASPPSSICHAAAAFDRPMVIVTGAREPTKLTDYPTAEHVTSVCLPARHASRYDSQRGCIHFRVTDERSCEHTVDISQRRFALCMACIPPETIANAIKRALTNQPR